MADEVDEIRSRVNIVDLVGQSVSLKKSGNRYSGLCPFHQDHNPSFSVSSETGRYKCWSCGESGDVFNWVMKTRNVEFREALEILADIAGVALKSRNPRERSIRLVQRSIMEEALAFFCEQFRKGTAATAYAQQRGLNPELLLKWEIGFAPDGGEALTARLQKKGFRLAECKSLFLVEGDESRGYTDKFRARLMFPIRDERGDLVAFGGRLLGDGNPKYINSGDTPLYKKSKVLYGLNVAKETLRTEREAVLVEGYLDVIACHCSDVKAAVASLGTALSQDHARLMRRWCDGVTILYDSDAAGQKAAERATEVLRAEGLNVRVASVPEGKDPDTLLRSAGPEAVRAAASASLSPIEYRIQLLRRQYAADSDDFWKFAVEAIAQEEDDLLRLRFISDLAQTYPRIRDAASARKALAQKVERARKTTAGTSTGHAAVRMAVEDPRLARSLHPAEAALFRAVLTDHFRSGFWPYILEDDLFLTKNGARLALELAKAFPEGAPEGAAINWLGKAHKGAQELLLSVEEALPLEQLTESYLSESLDLLKRKQDERAVQNLKDQAGNDRLVEILNKLQPHKL